LKKTSKQEVIRVNKERNNGVLTCYLCSEPCDESKPQSFVIEHKNNNSKDESPENLDIAHRGCNRKKDPPRIQNHVKNKGLTLSSYIGIYRRKLNEQLLVGTVAMDKNVAGMPVALRYAFKRLKKAGMEGSAEVEDLVECMCLKANVRTDTMLKWLKTWLCSEGYFVLCSDEKFIKFNSKTARKVFKKEIESMPENVFKHQIKKFSH